MTEMEHGQKARQKKNRKLDCRNCEGVGSMKAELWIVEAMNEKWEREVKG